MPKFKRIEPFGHNLLLRHQVFFAAEQSKEKKKDCLVTIHKKQTDEDSQIRNGASVSEGHGLSNEDHLFAASSEFSHQGGTHVLSQ